MILMIGDKHVRVDAVDYSSDSLSSTSLQAVAGSSPDIVEQK